MASQSAQNAFTEVHNTLSKLTIACNIGFQEIGTDVSTTLRNLEAVDNIVKEIRNLVKDQDEKAAKKIEKKKINALVQEAKGQIIFKKIPTTMVKMAHIKFHLDDVLEYEWMPPSADGRFQSLWIRASGSNMMKNAITMKTDWARELPPNSQEKRMISNIMVEEVIPQEYQPLLKKLRSILVNLRENEERPATFIQKVRYNAATATLAVTYQRRNENSPGYRILGYVSNKEIEEREFREVPWYNVNTGELHGHLERGLSAAATGAIRKRTTEKMVNKHEQTVATGANKLPIRRGRDGANDYKYPEPHKIPASPINHYWSNRNLRNIYNTDDKGRVISRPKPKTTMPELHLEKKYTDEFKKASSWINTSYLLVQDEIQKLNPDVIYGYSDESNPEVQTLRIQLRGLLQDKCPSILKEPKQGNTEKLIEIIKKEINIIKQG